MKKDSTFSLNRNIEDFVKRAIDSISKVSVLKHFFDNRHELLSVARISELLGREEEAILLEIEELAGCQLLEKELNEEGLVEYRLTSDDGMFLEIKSFFECFEDPEIRLKIVALILETQTFSK
jgi:hypothetical protein